MLYFIDEKYTEELKNILRFNTSATTNDLIILVITTISSFVLFYITKFTLGRIIVPIIKNSKAKWNNTLVDNSVFRTLAHLVPATIILFTAQLYQNETIQLISDKLARIYTLIFVQLLIYRTLNALNDMFKLSKLSKRLSIKGYIQMGQILSLFVILLLMFSIITGTNMSKILTGMTAMVAILILVFKDSILGVVSSIQIAMDNSIEPGDWVTVPSHNADGEVLEIGLLSAKVQNWDKTISSVPTYSLITDSYQNWRGMQESGGRRIKRSIFIDANSVKFCDDKLLNKLKGLKSIHDYIEKKQNEINSFNTKNNISPEDLNIGNGRKQTNLGIFREYLTQMLKEHPDINKNMTLMVRQLDSTEKGIPLEIYAFSSNKEWVKYEGIQADIFDFIFANIQTFELQVFQSPSGSDFRNLVNKQQIKSNIS
ncbi:MAG: mechanosensitive ion channel family protein [Bacteroidales bacterium]